MAPRAEGSLKENILPRNMFITCKTFPDNEKIRTSVVWNSSSPRFNHKLMTPILLNTCSLEKLK